MKRGLLSVFALCYILWVLLDMGIEPGYLLLGIALATLVSWFLSEYSQLGSVQHLLNPRRLMYFVYYLAILVGQITVAGVSLSRTILRRHIAIRPAVVAIHTDQNKQWALTLLANSITLTPGTFFLDMDPKSSTIYVHCISIGDRELEEVRERISVRYERLLSEVFG